MPITTGQIKGATSDVKTYRLIRRLNRGSNPHDYIALSLTTLLSFLTTELVRENVIKQFSTCTPVLPAILDFRAFGIRFISLS